MKKFRRYLSVPTGYAAFKHDLGGKITAPLEFAKDLCNIQHYTYFKDGGHFAAFEMPEELAKDVFTFFKKVYSAYKNKISGKKNRLEQSHSQLEDDNRRSFWKIS